MPNIEFSVRPGPSEATPLTISFRRAGVDEEGSRGGFEQDLSLEEANGIVRRLVQAVGMVTHGGWKAGR